MSLDPTVSFEELEQRRRRASEVRKVSHTPKPAFETESEALAVINEIFNPSLKLPESTGPYKLPEEFCAENLNIEKDLDISKLAELKEVFLLFDTDCDGLISKDDLRFTFTALGNEKPDEFIENMLKEAKDPLDFNAFVELMSFRTSELDPEDVLLEAWSKWDDYGTGKIEERSCLDHIEIFPYLHEPVIENTTQPEYVVCNHTTDGSNLIHKSFVNINAYHNYNSNVINSDNNMMNDVVDCIGDTNAQSLSETFIYSAQKVIGIRFSILQPPDTTDWYFNVTGEYGFLKTAHYKNQGRLIGGSFCDYYFFGNSDENATLLATNTLNKWRYFHSPRYPSNYPAHINCAYKFVGMPESSVEILFEELQLPKQQTNCNLDKLTIFDSESANMDAVIEVICKVTRKRSIFSSGPDMLIEFNASSNFTAKGFRGKFRFLSKIPIKFDKTMAETEVAIPLIQNSPSGSNTEQRANSERISKHNSDFKYTCKKIFDSRVNNSGILDTSELFGNAADGFIKGNTITAATHMANKVQCRYEFYGGLHEKVQIKFFDFNLPTLSKNSSDCYLNESLQILTLTHSKEETVELYCGAFIPKPILSNGPILILQFLGKPSLKGSKTKYYGFKAEYKFITNFGITTGQQIGNNCTFNYNSTDRKSGWFGSPNFPGIYLHNLVCNYIFYGQLEEKVLIRFVYFDVEGISNCEYGTASDYVELSNFDSVDRKYMKYCGKHRKFDIRSDGRFFRVQFYSNDRFAATGFKATYNFVNTQIDADNTSMQSYISSSQHNVVNPYLFFLVFVNFILKF